MEQFKNLPIELKELILKFYSELHFKDCLKEIQYLDSCIICYKYDSTSINKCLCCRKHICNKCWNEYCLNYGHEWKPFLEHCQNCTKMKMSVFYS